MKKHSSTFEVWTLGAWDFPGAWRLELGSFALSCLLAFLILIPVPVVCPSYALQDEDRSSVIWSSIRFGLKVNQASKSQ
jgi:hypothetical protein